MEFLFECSTRNLTSEHSEFSFMIVFAAVDPFVITWLICHQALMDSTFVFFLSTFVLGAILTWVEWEVDKQRLLVEAALIMELWSMNWAI